MCKLGGIYSFWRFYIQLDPALCWRYIVDPDHVTVGKTSYIQCTHFSSESAWAEDYSKNNLDKSRKNWGFEEKKVLSMPKYIGILSGLRGHFDLFRWFEEQKLKVSWIDCNSPRPCNGHSQNNVEMDKGHEIANSLSTFDDIIRGWHAYHWERSLSD